MRTRRVSEGREPLAAAWRRLAGTSPGAAAVGAELLERWDEPHRRYHTLAHLRRVLAAVDELAGEAEDIAAVRFAAWFHDAVYRGRPGRDEEESALLAERLLPWCGVGGRRVARVARLVRLTDGHRPGPGDADGRVLCDADLSVLGAPTQEYLAYTAAVRAEYAHVPDSDFRAGRAAVLTRLAQAPALFHTPAARTRWEERARANVGAELRRLGAGDGLTGRDG